MKSLILLVDFENVRAVDLTVLPSSCHVKIFVGKSQNSIPFALTSGAQVFGERLEWVKIAGDDRNNLDFHLAYYLGRLTQEFHEAEFVILSRDKGFDALIAHVTAKSIPCRRIETLGDLSSVASSAATGGDDPQFKRALDLLTTAKKSRPRRRKSLAHYISASQKQLSADEAQRIVDVFFAKGLITETNNALSYNF